MVKRVRRSKVKGMVVDIGSKSRSRVKGPYKSSRARDKQDLAMLERKIRDIKAAVHGGTKSPIPPKARELIEERERALQDKDIERRDRAKARKRSRSKPRSLKKNLSIEELNALVTELNHLEQVRLRIKERQKAKYFSPKPKKET